MKTRFVDDKQYMCLKRFGSQNIKHINRASGSCNKVFLFFQGVAIADDDRRIKGDVNVYRSHVKIIAYIRYVFLLMIIYLVLSKFKR